MTLTPKIAMSDDFLKSFAAVPRDQQQAVLTFVAKFRQNPTASGINYERIRDAGDPNMRSVRVNDNVRGIVLKPDVGNVYCLLWGGPTRRCLPVGTAPPGSHSPGCRQHSDLCR